MVGDDSNCCGRASEVSDYRKWEYWIAVATLKSLKCMRSTP